MLGTLRFHFVRFGFAGVRAVLEHRLLGRSPLLELRPAALRHPVTLRIGSSDVPTYDQVLVEREYDFASAEAPAVIVDAGANIGLASALFATRYPGARIISIEPEPENFRMLQRNTDPYPNVTPVQAALWSEDGEIELIDPGVGSWGFTTRGAGADDAEPSAGGASRVRSMTVARVLEEHDLERIDLLKIDIEGAELEVFGDAAPWIERVRSIVIELHEATRPGCERSFDAAVSAFPERWQRGENVYVSRPGVLAPASSDRPRGAADV